MGAATSERRSVVVTGGGIGGMAAAIGPSRAGCRVTVLERAAHPTLQYFAQGACTAIEDAVTPMREVAAGPDDLGVAFRRYQDKRITRTARIVLSSRELGRLHHTASVERLVRNDILGSRTPEDFYRSLDLIDGCGREDAAAGGASRT